MEYANFSVAIPVNMYLEVDLKSKNLKITKNEFILDAIFRRISNEGNGFKGIKNARFYTPYNGLME